MKDTLQLHEIAGYLPYGLKFMPTHFNNEKKTDVLSYIGSRITDSGFGVNGYGSLFIKPILRPMSDLIPIDDDEVNDMVLIKLVNETPQHCDAYDEWRDSYFDNPEPERILQAPYEVIQELYRQHFDIHNLIGRGLAIDINTLKD